MTLPSTNFIDVVACYRAPTLRVQSLQALSIGSPGALSLQLEAAEDDLFAYEMRSTSPVSFVTTADATVTSEPEKETSEVTIPQEVKEPKRRARPRKEHMK